MKQTAMRIFAVVLAAMMMLSMCGCEDMLYLMSEYALDPSALDSFYDSYGYDFGDYSYVSLDDYLGSYGDDYDYYGDLSSYFGDYSSYEDYSGSGSGEIPIDDFTNNSNPGGEIIVVSDIPETNVLATTLRDPLTTLKGDGTDVVTVMIYMCASDLESSSGLAYADIKEMMSATSGTNLNVVIETGGCTDWSTNQISSSTNQRHIIKDGRLTTVESRVGRKDMTKGETLTDFIEFCAEEYPANRNILILWDHGAGSIDGWGYDEYNYYDTLTIDELGEALFNAGVTFDFIGFDACLMSTMEVACVLYDFADYMVASEDYESGYGWEYKYWLTELAKDTSIPTPELARKICDDFVYESGTEDAILCAVDLSYMKLVYSTWRSFLFAHKDELLDSNFTWETENTGGRRSFGDIFDLLGYSTESEIADMLAIANAVDSSNESEALISALTSAITYCSANSGCASMTGLAVTLPYGDSSGYNSLKTIFSNVGFDSEYISLLGQFVNVSLGSGSYDWSDWYNTYDDYGTWSDYYSDHSDSYSDYDWDSWEGWSDFFTGYLGGSAASYFSDYFSDYYGHYDDYASSSESDDYSSYDDYYSNNYGDYSMEDYYNSYYDDYYDYGFGYSDYGYDEYNDYYDYYDYYYGDYYNDYYYGSDYSDWYSWFEDWFSW